MTTNPGKPPKGKHGRRTRRHAEVSPLGRLLSHWDETLETARKGRYSAERLLKYVVEEEYRAKRENARLLRRQRANIPEMLEMETFPFAKQPKLDRKKIMSYYDSFDYMTKQRNMVWLGPTGCGKTGLATAFLLQAIDRGIGATSSRSPSCSRNSSSRWPTAARGRCSSVICRTTVW